jgi:hypothetical protein
MQDSLAGTYIDRPIPDSSDVWTRFYYYTVNFQYSSSDTKHFYNMNNASGGLTTIWANSLGSREMSAMIFHPRSTTCPNGTSDMICTYEPNVVHVSLSDSRWYCIETHSNAGTAGVSNGSIELFVDGVRTLSYSNLLMQTSGTNYNVVRHTAQYGLGDRYIDDLVVGTERVGCSSTSGPPAAPTGLRVL